MLHRVALVITGVSEELSASFIRVTRIGERGTTLAVTSFRCTPRRNIKPQILHRIVSLKTVAFVRWIISEADLDVSEYTKSLLPLPEMEIILD
jgi:hypothetical protein